MFCLLFNLFDYEKTSSVLIDRSIEEAVVPDPAVVVICWSSLSLMIFGTICWLSADL